MLYAKDIDDYFDQLEKSRAYIEITSEQGPSEQLLAFINFDNKLEEEIGLEGFNAMSLQARHEILLSKLSRTDHDYVGIESFAGVLKVAGKLSLGFGKAALSLISTGLVLAGGLTVALVLSHAIKQKSEDQQIKIDAKTKGVQTFNFVKMSLDMLEAVIKLESDLAGHIPNGFTLKEWEEFSNSHVKKHLKALTTLQSKYTLESHRVPFAKSGWNADNFKSTVGLFSSLVKNYSKQVDSFKLTTDTVGMWIEENIDEKSQQPVIKLIEESLGHQAHTFIRSSLIIGNLKHAFKGIGAYFEKDS